MRKLIVTALRGYQIVLSPMLGPACRFHPTCSEYMRQAVERHGAARGVWLGLKRLSRCHPFHAGGVDPVR
ncbi:MAG: membrane protein insertion efficiency factor YidD [Bryobacteraceae bacterium]